jgi:hypothetical protein
VVAAGVLLCAALGRPAHLAQRQHDGRFQQAAGVEVLKQGREGAVEHGDLLPAGHEVLAVPVPVAEVEVDHRHPRLDQPPRQQEVFRVARRVARLGRHVARVALDPFGIFLRQVHRLAQLRRAQHVEGRLLVLVEALDERVEPVDPPQAAVEDLEQVGVALKGG